MRFPGLDYDMTVGGVKVGTIAVTLPVSREQMYDFGWHPEHGPPSPPVYGPAPPTDEDRYEWALGQLDDIPEPLRTTLVHALADALEWAGHECDW